jgi:hypothetical protein
MKVLSFQSDRHRETPVDLFAAEPFDFEYRTALVAEIGPGQSVHIVRLEIRELERMSEVAAVLRPDHGGKGQGDLTPCTRARRSSAP